MRQQVSRVPSRDTRLIECTRLPHRGFQKRLRSVSCPAVACLCREAFFQIPFWGSRRHAAWQAQISARAAQSAFQQRWMGRDINELMSASLARGNCIFACQLELKALPQPLGSQRGISRLQLCATAQRDENWRIWMGEELRPTPDESCASRNAYACCC